MTTEDFRRLHDGPIFVMPNPWDIGSARLLASFGFSALATTSAGYAHALGRADGSITREEAIAHAAEIVKATPLPVNGDLENGYGHDPATVAETVRMAIDADLAGCSIEDATGRPGEPIYPMDVAVERVAAAVEAAAGSGFVLTARAENYLFGIEDLADTINRLVRFQEVGADVVYAPGLSRLTDIAAVVASVDVPVNVLARAAFKVSELAEVGV
ncbi:MAG: isocitrate lyase/phosphoenolpyruvate mutase family protein, partial [Acidimicrobiia bacterium]|nr:isocitrate lyase/phosphoenolpyruvate mutase family protein [Acidimicrobiia bacterium]